jgi:uncharacterized FAD-dependent dehydrogenase
MEIHMRLRLEQVIQPLDYTDSSLTEALCNILKCRTDDLSEMRVLRRSLDARRRRKEPVFVLIVEVSLPDNHPLPSKSGETVIKPAPEAEFYSLPHPTQKMSEPPVVIGAGPAGLFAAFELASAGLAPILLERGEPVDRRAITVGKFWQDGTLNPESNALYGEGGAGTFSDGKLTARSKDRPRIRHVLETLVNCGADADILLDAEPHLGSDKLPAIVSNLRKEIIRLGGEVRFNATVTDIRTEEAKDGQKLIGIETSSGFIATNHCVLATGHSARDIYEMLNQKGVELEAKPFAIGLRLELPQAQLNHAQFGPHATHPRLGAASFRLTNKGNNKYRDCYTFCMCPGGEVIACASEPGYFTTNGMSNSARDSRVGNAACLVPVRPNDTAALSPDAPALGGIAFQRYWEEKAFSAGGADYSIPAMSLTDFLQNRTPKHASNNITSRHTLTDLHELLPDFVSNTLRHSLPVMLKRLPGINPNDAMLYGIESRSSAPVRIVRGKDLQSPSIRGLFPAGEGAGYAGGIISSAIDGLRSAEAVISPQ